MSEDLTEYVDAEFSVDGADSAVAEQRILTALEAVSGIAESRVLHGKVEVHYDPTTVTKKEIGEKIEAAGFHITEVEAAPASPIVDLNLPT
jgi:copper chaperone CopZ